MIKINLDVGEEEYMTISRIAGRAVELGLIDRDMIVDAALDLIVCHLNAVSLDLKSFLESSERDFNHDFLGIRRLISLRTGRFGAHWEPRCAKKKVAA